jgi:hypothetical protein
MDIEWQKRKVKSQYYVHFRIINVTKEIRNDLNIFLSDILAIIVIIAQFTNSIVVLLYMTIKEKNPTLIMY